MKIIPNDIFFGIIEETLAETGSVRFRVKGCSMQPLLRNERDEVTVERIGGRTLKRGDIVLFKYCGRHILHRILRTEDSSFILRGDNALNHETCTRADVLGIVTKIHRSSKADTFKDLTVHSFRNRIWPLTSAVSGSRAMFHAFCGTICRIFIKS